jgi:hypothetical protein
MMCSWNGGTGEWPRWPGKKREPFAAQAVMLTLLIKVLSKTASATIGSMELIAFSGKRLRGGEEEL